MVVFAVKGEKGGIIGLGFILFTFKVRFILWKIMDLFLCSELSERVLIKLGMICSFPFSSVSSTDAFQLWKYWLKPSINALSEFVQSAISVEMESVTGSNEASASNVKS